MAVTRVKQLDALYDDVRDSDLIAIPDAPFASGLNRPLDRAQLGSFAITPRRLAAGRRGRRGPQQQILDARRRGHYLPLDVDGTHAMILGIIDPVHVLPDRVEVVDYKTGRGRHAEAEYRKTA